MRIEPSELDHAAVRGAHEVERIHAAILRPARVRTAAERGLEQVTAPAAVGEHHGKRWNLVHEPATADARFRLVAAEG